MTTKKKHISRARLLKGEKKAFESAWDHSIGMLTPLPELKAAYEENKDAILEAAKIAKKMFEGTFGPLPPCYFCGEPSESAVVRPFKPRDVESDASFSEAIMEMAAMPSRLEGMPSLYICKKKRCSDRLGIFLKEQQKR